MPVNDQRDRKRQLGRAATHRESAKLAKRRDGRPLGQLCVRSGQQAVPKDHGPPAAVDAQSPPRRDRKGGATGANHPSGLDSNQLNPPLNLQLRSGQRPRIDLHSGTGCPVNVILSLIDQESGKKYVCSSATLILEATMRIGDKQGRKRATLMSSRPGPTALLRQPQRASYRAGQQTSKRLPRFLR